MIDDWHKLLKSPLIYPWVEGLLGGYGVLMGFRPRDLKRLMKRMGIEVEEVNATKIEVHLDEGSKLVIDEPQSVMIMRAKGQPTMIYVVGEPRRVEAVAEQAEEAFSDEDVRLVAEQAGVSLEEARRALEETGGDIAAAILKLRGEEGSA